MSVTCVLAPWVKIRTLITLIFHKYSAHNEIEIFFKRLKKILSFCNAKPNILTINFACVARTGFPQ